MRSHTHGCAVIDDRPRRMAPRRRGSQQYRRRGVRQHRFSTRKTKRKKGGKPTQEQQKYTEMD